MAAPSTTPFVQAKLDGTKVAYVRLGRSGLRVSYPILGAMGFGSKAWVPWQLEEAEALPVLKAAYDAGLTTWDTANMYSNGASERLIGAAVRAYDLPREELVLMTKIWSPVAEAEPGLHGAQQKEALDRTKEFVNATGLSRQAILRHVDACLRRLGTDYIDVLQIHRFDPETPVEETMRTLHGLVESGKVRYLGASSMWTYQFIEMQNVAEKLGLTKFVSMQNHWSLLYRHEELEMVKYCQATGVGIIPWSPLAGGRLTRPLDAEGSTTRSSTPGPWTQKPSDADVEIISRVQKIAKDKGWTMSSVGLTWLRQKGAIPITGISSIKRVEEAGELRGKQLSEEEMSFLEEPYVPKKVSGHA